VYLLRGKIIFRHFRLSNLLLELRMPRLIPKQIMLKVYKSKILKMTKQFKCYKMKFPI